MANVYGTQGRLLERLALNEELSVSQLARESGLSYPTTLYTVSSFPFVSFEKKGRERKVKIIDETVDAVYPFLIDLQTSRAKKAQLTLAFLSRRGLSDASLGGELALEKQLPVRDAEPDPEIEIRTRNKSGFKSLVNQTLSKATRSEFISNSRVVQDGNAFIAKKIGVLGYRHRRNCWLMPSRRINQGYSSRAWPRR